MRLVISLLQLPFFRAREVYVCACAVLVVAGLAQCTMDTTISNADVVVSVKDQRLGYYCNGQLMKTFKISTSKFGIGDDPNSCKTPLGRCEVLAKIGHGLPKGAVLKSRAWNGEVLPPNAPGRDPIVSRIMWLGGLERNNKNAYRRFIYIHGTTEENRLGTPASYGCVRMSMADVIQLFDRVNIGAKVVITQEPLPTFESMVATTRPAVIPASSAPPIDLTSPDSSAPGSKSSEESSSMPVPVSTKASDPRKQRLLLPVGRAAAPAAVPDASSRVAAKAVEPAKGVPAKSAKGEAAKTESTKPSSTSLLRKDKPPGEAAPAKAVAKTPKPGKPEPAKPVKVEAAKP